MPVSLSYTTMNALVHEPHTWLNKQMGLQRMTFSYMQEGTDAHRVIQDHVSGVLKLPILKDLPDFPVVEQKKFDEACQVGFKINDKYEFNGFVDGLNPEKKEILEIKSGKGWSPGEFSRLMQWKLYGLALKDYKKAWLINVPRNQAEWNKTTIKVFNTQITGKNRQEAEDFIKKALDIIKNIKYQKLEVFGRSKWCLYLDCPFGCEEENDR